MMIVPELLIGVTSNGINRFESFGCDTKPPVIAKGSNMSFAEYDQFDFQTRTKNFQTHGMQTISGSVIVIQSPKPDSCSVVIIERHSLITSGTTRSKKVNIFDILPHGSEPNVLTEPGPFQRRRWTKDSEFRGMTFSNIPAALRILDSTEGYHMIESAGLSVVPDQCADLIMLYCKGCETLTAKNRNRPTLNKHEIFQDRRSQRTDLKILIT